MVMVLWTDGVSEARKDRWVGWWVDEAKMQPAQHDGASNVGVVHIAVRMTAI